MIVNPGLRRVVSAIQRIFNSASFYAPLTHSLVLERGTGDPAFTRATEASFTDWEGVLRTVPAGCARFEDGRMVRNLLTFTEAFDNAAWTKAGATVTSGFTDPAGGSTAWRFLCSTNTGYLEQVVSTIPTTNAATQSWYFKSNTGVSQQVKLGRFTTLSVVTATTEWQRFEQTTASAGGNGFYIQDPNNASRVDILIWHPQVEDVTGQADQTASEYVSVGGVPTPVENNYLRLPGVVGNYASTPDSVAASITGDLQLIYIGNISDYGIINTLISKWDFASYLLRISAARKVLFDTSGTNPVSITSTASIPFNAGDDFGVKITVDADNGAGGSTTSIYTSADGGATWDLLEAPTITAGVLAIADTVDSVMVGNYGSAAGKLAGKIYRAQIYNGIDGTLAVDFDPTRYTGSYNGATMTNGSTVYYLPRNLVTYSEDFSNAAWTKWRAPNTSYNSGVAPDGATTADLISPAIGTGTNPGVYQTVSMTAGVAVVASIYVKASGYRWVHLNKFDGNAGVWYDLTNGVVGTQSAGLTGTITAVGSGWYRLTMLGTSAATSYVEIGLVDADNSLVSNVTADGTKGAYLWGAQLELVTGAVSTAATEYIPTTTTAVTGTTPYEATKEVWTLNSTAPTTLSGARITSDANFAFGYPNHGGGGVDGVAFFDTDRSGALLSPQPKLLVEGARTNHFLNSTAPAMQTSGALTTGTYTLWMEGTGSIAVAGNTATITGAGTATDGNPVTFVVTVGGTVDYTVTGSPTRAQAENGADASSFITTAGTAVTRNADDEQYPTSGNIAAAAGAVYVEFEPNHAPSGTIALWGTYVDASNYTAILHDATNMIMRKRIGGVNYDATLANAFVSGTTYKVLGSWGASGITITVDGTEGTPDADTTAAQIGAVMEVGGDGNSAQQPFAGIGNVRVWQRQPSSSERGAITS